MKLNAKEILQHIKEGSILGDPNTEINCICGIENGNEKSLSYIKDKRFLKFYQETKSSIVIIDENAEITSQPEKTFIKVKDPQHTFSKILKLFSDFEKIEAQNYISKNNFIANPEKISTKSYIGKNCIIEKNVQIFPNCFIGDNVHIKENTIIYSGVSIYKNCIVGKDCIIHSGAIIGADGFGFITRNKKNIKLYHLGNVVIKNDVEIGANTCIDKGLTHSDSTKIGHNVKIDNLVQIGHNVKIDSGTIIAGLCGIAGSTKIGKNCIIGGKVAISDHLEIADEVKIAGNSGLTKSIKKKGAILQGPIAFNKNDFQKAYIHFKNLDKNL